MELDVKKKVEIKRKAKVQENGERLKKRMGAFYTDPIVARKLVTLTLDPLLATMWLDLQGMVDSVNSIISVISVPKHLSASSSKSSFSESESLYLPLVECLKPIFTLRVCDPAMGNGVFLVETLRYLFLAYERITEILQPLPQPLPPLQILNRQSWVAYVLTHVLYGVDIRPESREITIHTLLRACHGWIENGSTELDNISDGESSLLETPLSTPLSPLYQEDKEYRLLRAKLHIHLIVANSLVRTNSDGQPIPDGVIPMDWSLEFPEIFPTADSGGFSALLCNPPWKTHQLNEPDFFSKYDPVYPDLAPPDRKLRSIALLEDSEIQTAYDKMRAQFATLNTAFGQWYPLQQEKKFNLFKLFLERAFSLLREGGRGGWIIPLGLFGEARATLLRTELFQRTAIDEIYHLFSGDDLFPNITEGQPFALFTNTAGSPTQEFEYYPRLHTINSLLQPPIRITLRMDQLRAISPWLTVVGKDQQMLALPLVDSVAQLNLLEHLNQFPKLRMGWALQAKRELNRTDDVRNGVMTNSPGPIPVLEGKHLVHYGFSVAHPRFYIDSRIHYPQYRPVVSRTRIVWRNVSNIRLRRRMFCAVIPPGIATVNSLNYICEREPSFSTPSVRKPLEGDGIWYLLGLLGSLVSEFQLRNFSTNNNLNQYLIENLSLPRFEPNNTLHQHLVSLVKEFQPAAGQWADRMVQLGHRHEAKATLTKEYWSQLARIDAVCIQICGLNLDMFAVLQEKFPKLDDAYFSMIYNHINTLGEFF
ncbi:MAG: Eco57I restriction-modification methylase domain-containing protein [Promethearchaeota archaeon]